MIRYFVGRASSGKTRTIYKEINRFINSNSDGRIILIVPEQFTFETESELIENIDIDGIINVDVISFTRLMDWVFDEVGKLDISTIDDIGKIMILRKIFENTNDLEVFDTIYKKSGFLDLFNKLIREFKRARINSEDLLKKFDEDILLTDKLKDIYKIYNKFEEITKGRYLDEEDKFEYFIDIIKNSYIVKNSYFYVDSFTGFTYQEIKIIEELMKYSRSVTMTFLIDENIIDSKNSDIEAFMPSLKYFNIIRKIAIENNIVEKKKIFKSQILNAEINHIEKNLFKYPYSAYETEVENIVIDKYLDMETEVENVAIKIINLFKTNKYKWSDFAVILGSLENYDLIIKRLFEEYNIPFFIDDKRSIMNNPIIKVVLFSLKSILKNFRYEDIFKLIKTGYIGIEKSDSDKIENYILKNGIKGSLWFKEFEDSEFEDIRKQIVEPLLNLRKNLKENSKVKGKIKAVNNYLEEIKVFNFLTKNVENLREIKEYDIANEYSQVWNILVDVFNQIYEINGDEDINLEDFLSMLESGFEEYEIGVIPPTSDNVIIGNLQRIRVNNIKNLFVIGFNDGRIPLIRSDYGILADEEKVKLIEEGFTLKSDLESVKNDEELSFYSILSKTKEKIFFSYSLLDSSSNPIRPSLYLDRLLNIFPNLKIISHILENKDEKYIVSLDATFRHLAENLRKYIDEEDVDLIWLEVFRYFYNNEKYRDKLLRIVDALFHSVNMNNIKNTEELYELPLKASVSRLEKFNKCPFSHFVEYGLKPKKREEYTVEFPDMGIIFHESIEKFGKEVFSKREILNNITEDETYKISERIVDDVVKDYGKKVFYSSYRYKYLISKIKRVAKRSAWNLVRHLNKSEFDVASYELKFGGKVNSIPYIILELENGEKLLLEGRIDRIDIITLGDENYAKILDYKSGFKKFDLSNVVNGTDMQLVVYMDAILSNPQYFRMKNIKPAGVFYFRIDDPLLNGDEIDINKLEDEILNKFKLDGMAVNNVEILKLMDTDLEDSSKSNIIPVEFKKDGNIASRSKVIDEEDFELLLSYVRKKLSVGAKKIIEGDISINPILNGDMKACDYCLYSSICQFNTKFGVSYKKIKKYKKNEVFDIIKQELT